MCRLFWRIHRALFGKKFFPEGYHFLNKDVAESGIPAWEHYVRFGKRQGRSMGEPTEKDFDREFYLNQNPDVKAAGMDPWKHYVFYGIQEGRLPLPKPKRQNQGKVYFSVIMPTYNRSYCICASIDAVLAQSYTDFELIIVDDGSTDGTEKLISERYSAELETGKIRYLRNEHSGVCRARNIGIEAARHEWIAYADSDNFMRPSALQFFAHYIKLNKTAHCFYAQIKVIQSGTIIGHDFSYSVLQQGNYIDIGVFVHTTSLYRTLGGFDEKLRRLVDWDLILRYTKEYETAFIPEILLDYNMADYGDRISETEQLDIAFEAIKKKHCFEQLNEDF